MPRRSRLAARSVRIQREDRGDWFVPSLPVGLRACAGQRKQRGFGRRGVRDGIQLRIVLAKRLGDFDSRAFQDMDELQGIDDRLALEVIIGNYESLMGVLSDLADACNPGSQLVGRIEIIVAFKGRDGGVIGEPGVVAAAVKADVAHRRRGLGGRRKRPADDRLIDITKAGVVLAEQG